MARDDKSHIPTMPCFLLNYVFRDVGFEENGGCCELLRGETRPFAGTVGASEAELEPEREAPFCHAIQEPTPNSLLATQKQPDVPEAILTEEAAF